MSERNFDTIVEGGFYKMRNGEIAGPAEKGGPTTFEDYPWTVGAFVYTDNGNYLTTRGIHMLDLIARVNPDGTPWVEQSEPTTEPEKRLPQPGEKWLTRGGFVATVKKRGESDFYGRDLTGSVLFESGEATARWRPDGFVSGASINSVDLVEYIGMIDELQAAELKAESISDEQGNDIATDRQLLNSLSDSGLFELALCGERGEDQQRIARAVASLGAKLLRKNADYGSSAWKRPILAPHIEAAAAIRVRMSDKLERIFTLAGKPPEVVAESMADTLDDLVGYWVLLNSIPEQGK